MLNNKKLEAGNEYTFFHLIYYILLCSERYFVFQYYTVCFDTSPENVYSNVEAFKYF